MKNYSRHKSTSRSQGQRQVVQQRAHLTLNLAVDDLARIRKLARLEQRSIAATVLARLTPEYPLDLGPVRELVIAVGHRAIHGLLTPVELEGLDLLP